jgi:hypothetical protein
VVIEVAAEGQRTARPGKRDHLLQRLAGLPDQPLRGDIRRLAQRGAEHHHPLREEAAHEYHRVAVEQLQGRSARSARSRAWL